MTARLLSTVSTLPPTQSQALLRLEVAARAYRDARDMATDLAERGRSSPGQEERVLALARAVADQAVALFGR